MGHFSEQIETGFEEGFWCKKMARKIAFGRPEKFPGIRLRRFLRKGQVSRNNAVFVGEGTGGGQMKSREGGVNMVGSPSVPSPSLLWAIPVYCTVNR